MNSKLRLIVLLLTFLCRPSFAAEKTLALFDEFVEVFKDNYAFFAIRGVDWEQQTRTYRPKISASTTSDELFSILCQMIDPLNDGHVFVSGERRQCGSGKRQAWEADADAIEDFIYKKYLHSKPKHSGAITY